MLRGSSESKKGDIDCEIRNSVYPVPLKLFLRRFVSAETYSMFRWGWTIVDHLRMKAYSVDLREKPVAAVGRGISKAQAARTFGVGATSVNRYVKLQEQGKPLTLGKAPGKKSKLDASAMRLPDEDLHARPALTYEKRAALLCELLGAVRLSKATICRATKRLRLHSQESSMDATERDEWLRAAWRATLAGTVDPPKPVFVDEMGTNTSLSPRYAYSPNGRRACAQVPRNRGANTTLLASMSLEGKDPCLAVEGDTTATVFEAYVEKVLAPSLRSGQIVALDNLNAHRSERARKLVEGRRCQLLFLPPYSPGFDPIEKAFSKTKSLLQRAQARTRRALIEALGVAISAVSARDARGFFEHSGYHLPAHFL